MAAGTARTAGLKVWGLGFIPEQRFRISESPLYGPPTPGQKISLDAPDSLLWGEECCLNPRSLDPKSYTRIGCRGASNDILVCFFNFCARLHMGVAVRGVSFYTRTHMQCNPHCWDPP